MSPSMSSQIWEDSQQIPETQLDDSQVMGFDSPDEKITLEGVQVKEEEEQKSKDSISTAATTSTSIARQVPPILVHERVGQHKADSWTDAPRKYRGVMHHACKPAA